jgi:hypothetical protein
MRKRRTREHIIADLSINHVERFALRCGYVTDRVLFDYGYDLILRTFDENGEVEPGFLFLQVKASDRPDYNQSKEFVSVRADQRDIIAWQLESVPVILVVYDAQEDTAYWIHIQSLPEGGRSTIRLALEQTLSEASIHTMRQLKADSQRRL